MKRISSLLLIIALLTLFAPSVSRAQGDVEITATVFVTSLNVRRAPSPTSAIIGVLYTNDVITLIGRTRGSIWLEADTDFGIGWVSNGFVTLEDGAIHDLPVVEAIPPVFQTTASPSINVRFGPDEQDSIVGVFPVGTNADVLGIYKAKETWYLVSNADNGNPLGWVRSDGGTIVGPLDSIQVFSSVPVEAEIISYRVNVHSDASLNSPVIATVNYKEHYGVVGADERGNWWQIQGSFGTGWILAQYVNVVGPTESLPRFPSGPLGQ